MSEVVNNDGPSTELEKPVPSQTADDVQFPPFPDPTDSDFEIFEENITEEERAFYLEKFSDLNKVVSQRLHCTACDRHLGNSAKNESKMKHHPLLLTLMCHTCHSFYNSGEFDKGDDGSELYCRWCGQGGQVYCCSDCPHVFCAKCIKRNFGMPKIREIENTDDWKCFRCNSKCLWDLRAICWALLRYCYLRNKVVDQCQDPILKKKYAEANSIDSSDCCKSKIRRREKESKKKEVENAAKKIISKISPSIQVKKFASMIPESEQQKKAQKRPASPKQKAVPSVPKVPIPIAPTPVGQQPMKKFKLLPAGIPPSVVNPVRFMNDNKKITFQYTRMARPRLPVMPIVNNFNGYNNATLYKNMNPNDSDNINLSIESLTQGLDISSMEAMNNDQQDSNVVCTPDFPLEPLCEVTEDNDDDVECITPGPVATPKVNNPPPLVPRVVTNTNIIQMTENDVTVNAVTGGLKFRVDPQTLSANKMYRLPDGRVFAINPNPNMPGGYSATIVSVSDATGKMAPRNETFAAKLSTVTSSTPKTNLKPKTNLRNNATYGRKKKPGILRKSKVTRTNEKEQRECDMKVPVEWYRYNLIDAIDALEYSLSRLETLKRDATTVLLRTRTVDEMKELHRTLDNHLATSTKRFSEIRENLNKELKNYILKKTKESNNTSEEDDDVLILPNDDNPIFIDEDSIDSVNENETQEVDLTDTANSEPNDSVEKTSKDPLSNDRELENVDNDSAFKNVSIMHITSRVNDSDETTDLNKDDDSKVENESKKELESMNISSDKDDSVNKTNGECESKTVDENKPEDKEEESEIKNEVDTIKTVNTEEVIKDNSNENKDTDKKDETPDSSNDSKETTKNDSNETTKNDSNDTTKHDSNDTTKNDSNETTKIKTDQSDTNDADMSEEMIEDLLKDEGNENMTNINCMDDMFDDNYP